MASPRNSLTFGDGVPGKRSLMLNGSRHILAVPSYSVWDEWNHPSGREQMRLGDILSGER